MSDPEPASSNINEQDADADAKPRWEKPNVFFKLVIPASMLFVITLFSLMSARMGAQNAPINLWLDQYGGLLMTGEVLLILLLTLIAIATDRRRLIEQRQKKSDSAEMDVR